MQETWRNNACTCKTSFSRLHFWFILISFQTFFPKFELPNSRCSLSTSVAYTPVFMVSNIWVANNTSNNVSLPNFTGLFISNIFKTTLWSLHFCCKAEKVLCLQKKISTMPSRGVKLTIFHARLVETLGFHCTSMENGPLIQLPMGHKNSWHNEAAVLMGWPQSRVPTFRLSYRR